jgi:hypothetical protein
METHSKRVEESMKVVKKTLERSLSIATHGKCIDKSFLLATRGLWLLIEYYSQNPSVDNQSDLF